MLVFVVIFFSAFHVGYEISNKDIDKSYWEGFSDGQNTNQCTEGKKNGN